MNKISKVKVLPGYRLHIEFEDGAFGTMDLAERWKRRIRGMARPPLFEQVAIGSAGELLWGDKIGLCPTLYR